jgi:phospholipase A1
MAEAVILIPGIMGSVLKYGDKQIWPASPIELLLPYSHMEDLLREELTATDVVRRVSISTQYQHLIDAMESCGFSESEGTLRVLPYDWRKNNALASLRLADLVDEMVKTLGSAVEINLIAHSMGGLVSRYYLESGLYNTRESQKNVKRLVTMGTPHRGAPMALAAAIGLEKQLFLNAEQVRQIANDSRYPALYQLLPPQGEPFAWTRGDEARLEPIDVYSESNASAFGLNEENLASAKEFHSKLILEKRPAHVRYFFFVGTRQKTTSSLDITKLNNGGVRVHKVQRDDSGDGTVPYWSGALTAVQSEPVGGEHGDLYRNGALKSTLAALLGKPGVLLAEGHVPEISLLQKVVQADGETSVTIDFPLGTREVKGELYLKRVVDRFGVPQSDDAYLKKIPITYSGAQVDHLTVRIDAPEYLGIYEVGFTQIDSALHSVPVELFVQE